MQSLMGLFRFIGDKNFFDSVAPEQRFLREVRQLNISHRRTSTSYFHHSQSWGCFNILFDNRFPRGREKWTKLARTCLAVAKVSIKLSCFYTSIKHNVATKDIIDTA